jgi:8-oxo-dGTP pyrophosphatase MutT (NUDIX family)
VTTPDGDFVQVAALPLTIGEDGVMRVLLLTSRETKRWVIPKGWPMKGRKPYEPPPRKLWKKQG